jgi:hypothetical protein
MDCMKFELESCYKARKLLFNWGKLSSILVDFSGPGCSSIGGGAFTELGPFFPNGDGRGLRKNSMSWNRGINFVYNIWVCVLILENNFVYTLIPDVILWIVYTLFIASNLLFVESPAGVGWSYSNTASDYNIGDAATGTELNFVGTNLCSYYLCKRKWHFS